MLNDPFLVHQRKQNLFLLLLPPLEILGCRHLSNRMTILRRGEDPGQRPSPSLDPGSSIREIKAQRVWGSLRASRIRDDEDELH